MTIDHVTTSADTSDETRWPSVPEAYGLVLPSYQFLVTRFEAADTRLTTLLTFAATLTLGAPLFAKNVRPELEFNSPVFVSALAFFVAGSVAGLVGRVSGRLLLPNPNVLYQRWLHKTTWEFKKDLIAFAGAHFAHNANAINRKTRYAVVLGVCLLFEIVAFVAWLGR